MKFVYPAGATPIDPGELRALIPNHLSKQSELNDWESLNIQDAAVWVFSRKPEEVMTEQFVRELHRRMFHRTWTWAGTYRKSEKNIGVAWETIPAAVLGLLGDASFWMDQSTFDVREIAIRFHHRLVAIHPFVNGNGRHARLMADALLNAHGLGRILWGATTLDQAGSVRDRYLSALRAADQGDYRLLLSYS